MNWDDNRRFLSDLFGDALGEAIDWIAANCEPDEVFGEEVLEEWAEDNDWVKGEE
jgi:hypothetical protein